MIFAIAIIYAGKVYADDSFSVTPSSVTLENGDSQSITISVSSNSMGNFSVSSSNSSVASVSASTVHFDNQTSGTFTIKAVGTGTASITVSATDVSKEELVDGNVVSVSGTKTISVTVPEKQQEEPPVDNTSNNTTVDDNTTPSTSTDTNTNTNTNINTSVQEPEVKLSNNADLSDLGITPKKYDFTGFTKTVTSYTFSVANEAEEIKIYATASDKSKAKVEGIGTKKLKEGKNSFEVKVTAEDGTTKTYTLNIERLAKTEENSQEEPAQENLSENNVDENATNENNIPDANAYLTKITIAGVTLSPQFKSNVYDYKIDLKEDIDKLDIQIDANSGLQTEIVGNEELKEGENTITILVTDPESGEIATYQITVNKSVDPNLAIAKEETTNSKKAWIACVVIVLILVVLIILFTNKLKNESSNDKEQKQKKYKIEEDDIDDRIYENNEIEKNNNYNYEEDDDNSQFKTAKSSFIKATDFVSATNFSKKVEDDTEERTDGKKDLEALLSEARNGRKNS